MDFSNPLPCLLVVLACLAAAHFVAAKSAFFRQRLEAEKGGRFGGVDGLRGFLAIGVFFTHVVNTWYYYTQGLWNGHPGRDWGSAGATGVALFFMITGFLFWRRVLRSPDGLDSVALYESRLRRIVPMYAVSVLLVMVVVAVMSGFRLNTGLYQFLKELRPWISFGFLDTGDLNGVGGARYINPVYWTLAYEWVFYLSLPLLALFARGPRCLLLFALVILFGIRAPIVLNFLCGALAALAVERGWLSPRLASPLFAPVALAALLAGMQFEYGPAHTLLLFVFFLAVLAGNNLYGLLATPAARLLGMVSYSYYLLHSIVLFVIMRQVEMHFSLTNLGTSEYWMFAGMAAVATALLSMFSYRHVEYPFFARRSKAHEGGTAWPTLAHAS